VKGPACAALLPLRSTVPALTVMAVLAHRRR
jgi:hypothetical protein